jgi:Flp pilus assembly protein TadG
MRIRQWRRNLLDRASGSKSSGKFSRNDNGSVAIEFGMVSIPFLILVFMLFGFAMYFFVMNSLDKGMDETARLLRTGQAQKADMTVSQFKSNICSKAGGWIQCPKVEVFVQKFATWDVVTPTACLNSSGSVNTNTASGSDKIALYSGTASEIVLVTTCYKWEFSQKLPFFTFGNMPDGSMMIQSSTAFRTEPYS